VNKIRRGLFGEWKEVDGIHEVKLDFGPGYRLYFGRRGNAIVVLVGGGDKSTQKKDIAAARKWWKEHRDEINEI
jgi:putative addiction module killer protein